jgi:hypothetical protein
MDFSVTFSGKIFKAYQTQSVIAERNKQSSVKSVQSQRDRVKISPQAMEELQRAQADEATQLESRTE